MKTKLLQFSTFPLNFSLRYSKILKKLLKKALDKNWPVID